MPRPRGKELSPHLRTRICEAKALGLTYPQIVARYNVTFGAAKYTVAQERLETILEPNDIFMQDNASIYKAHIILEWFLEMGITFMDWPYSPDLNPIENLWALLKVAIWGKYPDLEFLYKK